MVALLVRLSQINRIAFVSPDGATYLKYELLVYTQRLPFFPMLIHTLSLTGIPPLLAAKLISIFSGAGAVYVVTWIAREMGLERRYAWLAAVPLAVDPVFALHNVQPLTEGLFALLAALSTLAILRFWRHNAWTDLFGLLTFSGLAACTRAEGLVFAPLCLWAFARFIHLQGKLVELPPALLGLFPWLMWAVWQGWIVGHAGYLAEFGGSVSEANLVEIAIRALLHLRAALFHLLLVGAIPVLTGWLFYLRLQRSLPTARRCFWLLMYLLLATWLGISIHWYFDLRFSTPLVLWLSLFAGFGFYNWMLRDRLRLRFAQALVLAMMIAGLPLFFALANQMTSVGDDIALVAQKAKNMGGEQTVMSDELAMTSYHLGRIALPFTPKIPFRRATVILHDRYSDLSQVKSSLKKHYRIEEMAEVNGNAGQSAVIWKIHRLPEKTEVPASKGLMNGLDD